MSASQSYENENGFITYTEENKCCHISFIIIDGQAKKQGYGKKLLREFLKLKSKEGIEEFDLVATLLSDSVFTFDELVKFYENIGFIKIIKEEESEHKGVLMCLKYGDLR